MRVPDGYTLQKPLRSSADSAVYLAKRADGTDVVLKAYPVERGAEAELLLRSELDILRKVAGPGVPAALGLLTASSTPVLVLEHVPGVSLLGWVEASRPSIPTFLEIAIQLSEVLVRVHAAHVIHRDLGPRNIVIDPATERTHLVHFGLAQPLGSQVGNQHIDGSLHFIAPEQTGRMNRGIDTRSDLYGLGAVLYFTLTQRTLFDVSDPLSLVHAHMARVPRAPDEVRPDAPPALSRILMKLVEKEPEARYQTASALLSDLRCCRDQLAQRGQIDDALVLGMAEAPDRPRFSSKLHGREAEIALLRSLYGKAAAGSVQLLVLGGEPGSGKSAIVDELRPQLAETSGYLAVGKFDLSRERPYGAWSAALQNLVQQLLVQSDARFGQWTATLRDGLGGIAQVLIELVPDLGYILGEVPAVPTLGPRETQARLSLALGRFIRACATPEHPIALFLDDLQWSDASSRALLEDLLGEDTRSSLLVIGAYRSSEVTPDHPVSRMLERLSERRVSLQSITLGSIPKDATEAMLAEALHRTPADVRRLAERIERTTGSTPLFVRQFVEHIHARGLLTYSAAGGWTWDDAAVAAADIPDGAAALMTAKVQRLAGDPRAVIELASCVGDEFDLDLLCQLSRHERSALERGLYALCDETFIAPSPGGFRFLHDRVREAAQALLSEEHRTQIHYDIAQLLLARLLDAERGERLLEIVEHLNAGLAHVPQAQRFSTLELHVAAGRQALASGAPSTAEKYLSVARTLFSAEDWQRAQPLGFELFMLSAESAYLRNRLDHTLALLASLDARKLSILQKAQLEAKRMLVYALTRSPEECTREALQVLRGFGIKWPLQPSRLRAKWALLATLARLRLRGVEAALRPAAALDPSSIAPIIVIGASGAVMTRTHIHLAMLLSSWILSNNLRRGYLARPLYSLLSWCMIARIGLGQSRQLDLIAERAQAVMSCDPDPIFGPRGDVTIHALDGPWRTSRRRVLAPLERVAEKAREFGDLEYHYYARFMKAAFSALAGEPIRDAERDLTDLAEGVRRSGLLYPEAIHFVRPYRLLLAANPRVLAIEEEIAATEAELASQHESASNYVRTVRIMVLCVYSRWEQAFAQSELIGPRRFTIVPYVHLADHTFFRGLAAARLAASTRGRERSRYRSELKQSLKHLQRWSRWGPDFEHMVTILEAERACIREDWRRAQSLYERAAERAREQEFLHHCALAHEGRARLFAMRRRETEAAAALAQAIVRYRDWGCEAKALALEEERTALLGAGGR